ncbi:MAG: hypothetical protein HQK75_10045 [Candidatus Magnetomorum sp.]|nr:hypothetical protein [Candidatus Magnetomorum sp.]
MKRFNHITSKIENLMTAITFAEAGEHETALQMMEQDNKKKKRNSKTVAAVKYVDHRPRLTV